MDDKQMLYFLQVCKYHNITKAAQNLYISQQALSAAIHRLEQELDVPLFERTKYGMALTIYGAYVQKEIEQICTIRNHMKDTLDSMKSGYRQTLRIGVSFGVINFLPDDFFSEFEKTHPGIELYLQEYTDIRCEEAVLSGKEELGFGIAPVDKNIFQSHTVIQNPMCILVNEQHKLSGKKHITFEELRNEHFLLPTNEFKLHHIFVNHCHNIGFEPKIRLETMEVILAHNWVRLNKGIGISIACETDYPANVRKIPFSDKNCKWEVCLIRNKHCSSSQASQAFWDYAAALSGCL